MAPPRPTSVVMRLKFMVCNRQNSPQLARMHAPDWNKKRASVLCASKTWDQIAMHGPPSDTTACCSKAHDGYNYNIGDLQQCAQTSPIYLCGISAVALNWPVSHLRNHVRHAHTARTAPAPYRSNLPQGSYHDMWYDGPSFIYTKTMWHSEAIQGFQ